MSSHKSKNKNGEKKKEKKIINSNSGDDEEEKEQEDFGDNNNDDNEEEYVNFRMKKTTDIEKGLRLIEETDDIYLYKIGSLRRKRTFNNLFLLGVGMSLIYSSLIVAFLENNPILKPFYSNEIIVIMSLGLIIASIYGIFHQLKIYTYLLTTTQYIDQSIRCLYNIVAMSNQNNINKQTMPYPIGSESISMTFPDSVEQMTVVMLMTMWSFHWQMSLISIMAHNELTRTQQAIKKHEASAIIEAIKVYPVSVWISYDWKTQGNNLEKIASCFADRILPSYHFCKNFGNMSDMQTSIEQNVNDIHKKMDKTETSIKTMFISTNNTSFKIFGILFYLSAPFILLPEHGHSTILWYLIIVLFSGYFFALRWFIGDVLNDITETYSNDVLSKIQTTQKDADSLFLKAFGRKPKNINFTDLHTKFVTRN